MGPFGNSVAFFPVFFSPVTLLGKLTMALLSPSSEEGFKAQTIKGVNHSHRARSGTAGMGVQLFGPQGLFLWTPLPFPLADLVSLELAPLMDEADGHLSRVIFLKCFCPKNVSSNDLVRYLKPLLISLQGQVSIRKPFTKLTHLRLQKTPGLCLLVNI